MFNGRRRWPLHVCCRRTKVHVRYLISWWVLVLHTSTFSAFQVSYKNALYKSTVIIIIIILECMSEMCCTRLAEIQDAKIAILAPSHNFVGLYLRSWDMYRQSEEKLLNAGTSLIRPYNMVNFGLLTAEICWRVWGTPANFNGFRVLAALLHCTLVVSVSQTLRRWTEGATYVRQGHHHVGHWPTF